MRCADLLLCCPGVWGLEPTARRCHPDLPLRVWFQLLGLPPGQPSSAANMLLLHAAVYVQQLRQGNGALSSREGMWDGVLGRWGGGLVWGGGGGGGV